jgi:hypothetical protein
MKQRREVFTGEKKTFVNIVMKNLSWVLRKILIHIRDNHTFECNMWEIQLENKEDLDVHLLTCEMYNMSAILI